ncbi:MAG: Prolipoprotein diacylglyceryl transferase [Deltaproteobacteria bacterium ADurb.Bin510]|nr:MAG: Prolipoprotein diacylglyceryl transferase [Deltaproteobacteria bacterium ADurb.Bin510]
MIGFICAYLIAVRFARRRHYAMSRETVEDLLFWCIVGVILGGRLGYCLIYNLDFYASQPLEILKVWHGGMSFHGALLGLLATAWFYARKKGLSFLMICDIGALAAPPGLFFGRIGNFINAELWGRVTTVPWGMVFPGAGPLPRHPSQLYESLLEGLGLMVILYLVSREDRPHGVLIGTFLAGYGCFRFVIEFFREPDAQMGFIVAGFTMGQILCTLMVLAGTYLLVRSSRLAGKDR